MTNPTEIPEKIYIYPDTKRVVRSWCGVRKFSEDVPYIRKDAIPSKAEAAREFLREIIPRAQKTQKYFQEIGFDKVKHDYVALNDIDYALSFAVAFKEVLKEWEDAEK